MLEHLIAQGISEIVIQDRWRYEDILSGLPSVFRRAIRFTSEDAESISNSTRIFKPFFDEFGLEVAGNSGVQFPRNWQANRDAIDAGVHAWAHLPTFLTALTERAHCHLDIKFILKSLSALASQSRSPELRANIAVLKGIFTGYSKITHASLQPRINSSLSMTELFEELLDNAEYQALSREVSTLGVAQRISGIKRRIGDLTRAVLRSDTGRRALDYGSTAVSVATGLPLPKSDLAASLLRDSYFPPLVNVSAAIEIATLRTRAAHPDIEFVAPLGSGTRNR